MNLFRALAISLALAALPAGLHAENPDPSQTVHLGPLVLSGGFSRATLPNAPVAGGFLTIENTGDGDDRLIGATSDIAGHMEVHEMAMQDNVMKMRQLADGLPIPAGQTVVLKPGGFHLMFIDLKGPLKQGDTVAVTLTFDKAGSVEVPLVVGPPNAKAPGPKSDMKMQDSSGSGSDSDSGSGAGAPEPALPGAASPEIAG